MGKKYVFIRVTKKVADGLRLHQMTMAKRRENGEDIDISPLTDWFTMDQTVADLLAGPDKHRARAKKARLSKRAAAMVRCHHGKDIVKCDVCNPDRAEFLERAREAGI